MKKYLLIILTAFLILITACSNKNATYTNISYTEYLEKIERKESFPLLIGSETCSACQLFKGTMETFMNDYKVEVFYIDISKITEEEYNALQTQTSFEGTPTTVFYKDGVLTSYYNRLDGSASYSSVVDIYKENGYVK